MNDETAGGQGEGGVLVRGSDGALYFISGEQLTSSRLSPDRADQVKDELDLGGTIPLLSALPARAARRVGLLSADDEPTVVVCNQGAIRQIR